MQTFTAEDGTTYPVSDATPLADPADWSRFDELTVEGKRKRGRDLNARERAWLTARDNRATMQRIVDFLEGRDFTEVGPTLDCVSGQTWEPDTCGCKVALVRNRFSPADEDSKPHKAYRRCPAHAVLADDTAHHDEVKAENTHKNKALKAASDASTAPAAEISWSYNERRELVLKHERLKSNHGQALASLGRKVNIG